MGNEPLMAVGQIESRMRFDVDIRIDGQEPFLHDFDFRPANSLDRRAKLTVHIGRVKDIGINQDEMTDASPAQGFDDSRPNTADAKDKHLFRIQFVHLILADEAGCPLCILFLHR